jgi:hypothetical protein
LLIWSASKDTLGLSGKITSHLRRPVWPLVNPFEVYPDQVRIGASPTLALPVLTAESRLGTWAAGATGQAARD